MSRAELEGRIGYVFRDTALLELALSHASFSYEQSAGRGNERLEFLGDAVLGLAIAHELYRGHPDWNEGDLTRARAALVNGRALAEVARRLDLPPHIRLGRTEQASGGEQKDRVLANVLEALIGAIYLDGGLAPAQGFLRRCFAQELAAAGEPLERDPKTALQEWAHAVHRATPSYVTVGDSGQEADDLRFCVEVRIAGQAIASGAGRSKRAAELAAARAALARREPE
jgi:ribonuclease-3